MTRKAPDMLHLEDQWIWDFWLIDDGPDHHVFYLQAPRSLGDPELRHRHATIGHPVSGDLRSWDVLRDALGPGPAGAWDDQAPWTGSIIRAGDRWHLGYTGTSSIDGGLIQRIGIAVSDDLVHWERSLDDPASRPTTAGTSASGTATGLTSHGGTRG
jgi:beta-fructofuranosidase